MDKKPFSGVYIDAGLGDKSKTRYKKRRQKLAAKIGHLSVIYGLETGPGAENPWNYANSPIYQEPLLMFLTGINQLKTALLLDPNSKDSKEVLFLSKRDPNFEFWQGLRLGVGDQESCKIAKKVTGFKDIRDISELDQEIIKRLKAKNSNKKIGCLWHETNQPKKRFLLDSNGKFKLRLEKLLTKNKISKSKIQNISKVQWDQRLVLDNTDIQNTRTANLKTTKAFTKLLKNVKKFTNETQVCGFLDGHLKMESPYGLSFSTISASGANATILHYEKNDDPIHKNELILMDFGTRWMTMHSDISRTFPVNGVYNPLQKILYNIALKAQLLVEKAAKAGTTINHLNDICWNHINKALDDQILQKGGKIKLKYEDRPHGVSHLMGEQEHDGDPFGHYKNQKMKEGWLISNEPGIYGFFDIKIDGKRYKEHIGIRIEDNLLITKTGCVNLSKGCPKTISQIEKLMA